MKQILGILVENHPGVLSKVSGLFSRRGFNIYSLAVGITEDPSISRITIVVEGDEYIVEQVTKQLNKLVDVIKVANIGEDSVTRELALIKVMASPKTRHEVIEITNIFRAQVVDIAKDYLIVEITGDSEKISALVDMLKDYGIKEMVRTGAIAIDRGGKMIKYEDTERGGFQNGDNVL
ncbi:MAG: acetolactate synthase small subunit [Clostridiales bacterium]|nr:acetolactate synthase small subunit [Clostridiales bacterium]